MNYYNEFDPNAAAWLRQLIAEGLIPPGEVDQRSITDVSPAELSRFTQCHFFAGVGGWSLALQLAGWPADRPVWTGSCPCQPFSVAGKGKGTDDERHLWPAFFGLIRECRPDVVFGEQVESAVAHGWLDGIRADLEGEGYACGDITLGAHSLSAPHIRQRLYWVADSQNSNWRSQQPTGGPRGGRSGLTGSRAMGGMANSISPRLEGYGRHGDHGHESRWNGTQPVGSTAPCCAACGRMADAPSDAGPQHEREPRNGIRREAGPSDGAECGRDSRRLGNAAGDEQQRHGIAGEGSGWTVALGGSSAGSGRVGIADRDGRAKGIIAAPPTGHRHSSESAGVRCERLGDSEGGGFRIIGHENEPGRCGYPDGASLNPWADSIWILCRDGKHRRIPAEPALFPLADGLPYKVARRGSIRPALLKGAGNAIVPQVAALFIQAFLQS